MYKKIFKAIKTYNNIVIARHVGVDPDAMASQIALRDSIKISFPEKKVYAIGNGTTKFNFLGKLDRGIDYNKMKEILLIVLDTPDKKRIDMEDLTHYEYSIKIDHHPHIETFCNIELIEEERSSASEIVYDLIKKTKLEITKEISETLYAGIVADTNRFLFNNSKSETFQIASQMIKEENIDITKIYQNLYQRPINEVKMFGYMVNNMKITKNKLGYIKITNEELENHKVDAATSGNLINEFNNIEELIVWLTATEDKTNDQIRVSIRSKAPVINKIAENFGGGGHALASGVKLKTFQEVDQLITQLEDLCKEYIESSDKNENY